MNPVITPCKKTEQFEVQHKASNRMNALGVDMRKTERRIRYQMICHTSV